MTNNTFTANLSAEAKKALLSLALEHELITGSRTAWRKQPIALLSMIMDSLNSSANNLVSRAKEFLKCLSPTELAILEQFGITLSQELDTSLRYRGSAIALVEDNSQSKAPNTSEKVYRGSVISNNKPAETHKATQPNHAKGKRVYRGSIIED